MNLLLEHTNYWMASLLMMAGFYLVIASGNLVKKLMGLGLFQSSILLLYISVGYVRDAGIPLLAEGRTSYVNPLPQVLVLTAIVVGIATLAVGLALVIRIREEYGTVEENALVEQDEEPS